MTATRRSFLVGEADRCWPSQPLRIATGAVEAISQPVKAAQGENVYRFDIHTKGNTFVVFYDGKDLVEAAHSEISQLIFGE